MARETSGVGGDSEMDQNKRLAVGLMSGTSTDGIDAAVIEVKPSGEPASTLVASIFRPFSPDERQCLLEAAQPNAAALQVKRADIRLGEWLGDAVQGLLYEAGLAAGDIRVIGSHGHTVAHYPEQGISWQIGNPHVLAEKTGIGVVTDFRQRDVTLGGQGAPLVPYYDYVMFHSRSEPRVLLNLGGISNLTVLQPSTSIDSVTAWDAGPANMILDGLMMAASHNLAVMDEGGRQMAQGQVNRRLLQQWLRHPYFEKAAPKSTGREEFGQTYVQKLWEDGVAANASLPDILATAGELIAVTIGRSLERVTKGPVALIAAGGGTHNRALMAKIAGQLNLARPWQTTGEYGISEDIKEAMAFAYFGWQFTENIPINIPQVTGARRAQIMGTFTPAGGAV